MPHQRGKKQLRGVGDIGGSSGGESSWATMTATTGNED
jgi:hypothetical protein